MSAVAGQCKRTDAEMRVSETPTEEGRQEACDTKLYCWGGTASVALVSTVLWVDPSAVLNAKSALRSQHQFERLEEANQPTENLSNCKKNYVTIESENVTYPITVTISAWSPKAVVKSAACTHGALTHRSDCYGPEKFAIRFPVDRVCPP